MAAIPISLGLSGSRATNTLSGGPFFVDASIVFGDRAASDSPYQGYSPDLTATPTILPSGTGQGSYIPGTVSSATGSSMTMWLLLGGAAVAAWLIYKNGI
jgi:hypothetical protein